MIRTKAIVIAIIIISFSMLSANGGVFGWKGTHGTVFHLTMGSQTVDLTTLNEDLALFYNTNYPTGFFGLGAQYLYISNNLIIGAEGKYLSNGNHKGNVFSQDQYYHFRMDGTAGFFDLGYVLYTNRYSFVAPWVGIGMGNINFAMTPSDQDWINVVEYENFDTFSVNRSAMMMNWGICGDIVFRTWSVGLSLGYMHPIGEGDWQLAGEVYEDGPDTYLTGFYINLNLGYSQLDLWSNIVN